MALFAEVAELAEMLAGTSSRLKKRAAIEAALRAAARNPMSENPYMGHPNLAGAGLFALYLAGQPFAENDPRKLNAGGALLSRAVLAVSGANETALTTAYRRHGDLGAAAFDLMVARDEATVSRLTVGQMPVGQTPGGLTLGDVAEGFAAMAVARTTAARAALVEGLLRRATALEAKYLLKLMLGDMRIGVKQSLVEEAIAGAAGADVAAVRHAVMLEADLARVVERAFAGTLDEAKMTLFHPLGFMLASPVETPEEAVARFTEAPRKVEKKDSGSSPQVSAFLEDKYDGMRAQVHCGDVAQPGRVAIYSRNREDVPQSFPELEEAFSGVDEPLILDGEILGWDYRDIGSGVGHGAATEASGQALPFAVLGQRIGRKVVSNELRTRIPVVFMAFDLLFEQGELLLSLPLSERRARLEAVVERWRGRAVSPLVKVELKSQAGLFESAIEIPFAAKAKERLLLSPSQRVADAEAIDRAYRDARARANEGVMLKAANSAYLPGRRGLAWVKLKRELATLDVAITGAEFGHGKRAGLLSDYTFAVRGADGELLNVGKAYSGVTDAEIAALTEWLKAHTLEDRGHFRTVEPHIVLEVAFNNIMRSTRHASGFALRFPRILRIRTDKPLEEIDTLERVEEIYRSQPDRPAE
ncbi:MAG: ATP-dependent DNA ligase [Acidobacteriota bacterium]|nr:ATP-dependent DNA ligase [Acidobacteriota bacterium]